MELSHERQEILSLRAQPPISPKEVVQLPASIATLEAQAQVWEENARTQPQLAAVSESLTISTACVGTLEGYLRVANSSPESSAARVTRLEAALESTQKLLEASRAEGK
jgi:hypothetical protein